MDAGERWQLSEGIQMDEMNSAFTLREAEPPMDQSANLPPRKTQERSVSIKGTLIYAQIFTDNALASSPVLHFNAENMKSWNHMDSTMNKYGSK